MTDINNENLKVSFFPVAKHQAEISLEIIKRKGIRTKMLSHIVSYYGVACMILLPAVFLFNGNNVLALIFALITVGMFAASSSWNSRNEYDCFYQQWLDDDPEQASIQLTDLGIDTSSKSCSMHFPWAAIIEMRESDDAIYFLSKDAGLAAPKTSFSSDEHLSEFVGYDRERVNSV